MVSNFSPHWDVVTGKASDKIFTVRNKVHKNLIVVAKSFGPRKDEEYERERDSYIRLNQVVGSDMKPPAGYCACIPIIYGFQDQREPEYAKYPGMFIFMEAAIKDLSNELISDVPVLKRIISEVATALQHCHSNGVVYCDMKPENVLVFPNGSYKLCDFDKAILLSENLQTTEFDGGKTAYTIGYRPPETVLVETLITPKLDVWQLGALMYYLITGKTHDDIAGFYDLEAVENPEAEPSDKLFETIPAILKSDATGLALLRKMLKPNPDARPNMAQVLKDKWFK